MLVKNLILTFFIFGICSVSIAQNLNALDENNGFQNYKFGMQMNQFSNCDFETVEDGGAERCIIRRTHLIGDIEARSVELYFVDSILAKIKVNFRTEYSDNLREAVRSAFGSSTGSNFNQQYGWMGPDRTYRWEGDKVTLRYTLSPAHQFSQGSLYLEYKIYEYDELVKDYRAKKYTPSDF